MNAIGGASRSAEKAIAKLPGRRAKTTHARHRADRDVVAAPGQRDRAHVAAVGGEDGCRIAAVGASPRGRVERAPTAWPARATPAASTCRGTQQQRRRSIAIGRIEPHRRLAVSVETRGHLLARVLQRKADATGGCIIAAARTASPRTRLDDHCAPSRSRADQLRIERPVPSGSLAPGIDDRLVHAAEL